MAISLNPLRCVHLFDERFSDHLGEDVTAGLRALS